MCVVTTRAVLLRTFNYSETSQVLRFYTPAHGVVGVMARGVRRSSGKGRSGMETFGEGELTVYHRASRDLQTLKEFSLARPHRGLARHVFRFAGASILAELILKHGGADANPDVYRCLLEGLGARDEASEPELEGTLLTSAWALVGELGYTPQLDPCVHCFESLGSEDLGRFDFGAGGVRCPSCAAEIEGPLVGPGARVQLAQLFRGDIPGKLRKPGAQLRLLSDFVTYHISGGRPLQSFAVLEGLRPDRREGN